MNKNIDLTKILMNCPKWTKFYSTIYGEVAFNKINKEYEYPITFVTSCNSNCDTTTDGRHYELYYGECTLFPSRDQRDWSKFTAPWLKKEKFDPKTLKPFDKIIFKGHGMWFCGLFSHIHNSYACVGETYYKCVIPYNDDTKHLLGTKDEAPDFYRYWED